MAVHVISYDLNKAKNYQKLYEAIEGISGEWCHPVDSTWYVQSNYTTEAITKHLIQFIDSDDVLIVSLTDGSFWSGSLHPEAQRWMQEFV